MVAAPLLDDDPFFYSTIAVVINPLFFEIALREL